MQYFLKLLALSLICIQAQGQISGTVYLLEDGKETPAPLAEVFWKGSKIGTTTDENGKFTIEKTPGFSILAARFTGFRISEKMIISRKGTTNFTLISDSEELEGVTVTGKAKATQIDAKAAGLNFRIDETELRKAACCNLSESFETNASIDVSFSDGISGTKQIEILGLAGKYALIQRENIPFARGMNANNGLAYIPGPFIESIQVTKGLSSVLNGYESITGQINVEYYKPENAPQLLVNAFLNQGARSELNILYSYPDKEHRSHTTMLHYSNIPFAQDRNEDNFADLTTGDQINLLHRSHYHIGDNWEGQIGLNLVQDRRKGGQIAFIDKEEENAWGFETEDRRFELFGKNGYISPSSESESLGIIYSLSGQERSSIFGSRKLKASQNTAYLNTIYQNQISSEKHQFKTGLSLLVEDYQELLDSVATNLYAHQRDEIVPGAYFEYNFSPNEDFSLVAGIRGDYNSYFQKLYWSPRLQARYQWGRNTTLRLSGGRGQRSPNRLAENASILASNRKVYFSDLNLIPEIAWNAGFSWSQNIIIGSELFIWNTDVFYTWFESKIVNDLDYDPLAAFIISRQGSQSFSALSQIDYSPVTDWEFRLAYKYLRAEENFLEGLNLNYGIPEHRAFLNGSYQSGKKWKFDLTLNWFGRKRLPSSSMSPVEFQQADFSPSFFTLNGQINKEWKNFEFFAGVDNLFNFRQENPIVNADQPLAPYFDSNFIWGPIFGRNIYLGLYYRIP